MRQRLSSSLTFLQARIMPVLLLTFLVVFGFLWWSGFARLPRVTLPRQIPGALAALLVVLLAGIAYSIVYTLRLKAVWLEGDHLVVSNFASQEDVPLRDIDEVWETRLYNPKLIKVQLRRETRWGSRIVFIAPWSLQLPFTDHWVVRLLRERAAEARAGSPGW